MMCSLASPFREDINGRAMHASTRFALLGPSERLGASPLFAVDDRVITVDDVVAAAAFRDVLAPWIDETRALLSAGAKIDGGDSDAPSEEDLQVRSEAFRYEHDLITAEETEEWLSTRGITVDEFGEWFRRKVYHDSAAKEIDNSLTNDPEDFPDQLRVHLWMSEAMETLSTELSRRFAADRQLMTEGPATAGNPQPAGRAENDAWLKSLGRDSAWLAEMTRLEAAYQTMQSRITTERSRASLLNAMRLPLTRIEIASLELDSPDAAQEFYVSCNTDGLGMIELAGETGFNVERGEHWLDSLEESLQRRMLSASEGAVIEPVAGDGRFTLYQVLRKIEPSLEDAAVVARIDEILTDRFFSELCGRHIKRSPASGQASG